MNQEKLRVELIEAMDLVSVDPSKAQLFAEKAMIRAQRHGWVGALALSHMVVALISIDRETSKPSLEDFYKALTLFRDLNESNYVAQCYFGLGRSYSKMGQYSLALEQYRKALSNDLKSQRGINLDIHLALAETLMNIGQWSDAEQELMGLPQQSELSDIQLVKFQLQVLRLAFYRGDKKTIKDQLKLCEQLAAGFDDQVCRIMVAYYQARYEAKFARFKVGYKQLEQMWRKGLGERFFYLQYEAGQDFLRSDYPKKGIQALTYLLELEHIPEILRLNIHQLLARFYASHLRYEYATLHYQFAEELSKQLRVSEINEQWARLQVEEQQQSLKEQIAIEKHNNSVLAESNAMLQAVNRIAMSVNASLDYKMLCQSLRDQLVGWINVSVVGIAEVTEERLDFKCIIDNNVFVETDSIPLTENRSWSVRAVNEGRVLYDNNFVISDEILVTENSEVVKSVCFVPLKFESKVIGILSLQSNKPQVFDVRSISLLEYIAPVVSIAFANLVHLNKNLELKGEVNRQRDELRDVRDLVAHLSDHDEVTGLPNRQSLSGHFNRWRPHGNFHCLMMSVTNLSDLANLLGYGSDEEIIKVVAKRLINRLRPDDLLVRGATDQFIFFVERMRSDEVLLEFANKMKFLSEQPLRAKDQTINASIAIGIVSFPDHGESLEELMSMASVTLSHALSSEDGLFLAG